jgi:hypothetical protein
MALNALQNYQLKINNCQCIVIFSRAFPKQSFSEVASGILYSVWQSNEYSFGVLHLVGRDDGVGCGFYGRRRGRCPRAAT